MHRVCGLWIVLKALPTEMRETRCLIGVLRMLLPLCAQDIKGRCAAGVQLVYTMEIYLDNDGLSNYYG